MKSKSGEFAVLYARLLNADRDIRMALLEGLPRADLVALFEATENELQQAFSLPSE